MQVVCVSEVFLVATQEALAIGTHEPILIGLVGVQGLEEVKHYEIFAGFVGMAEQFFDVATRDHNKVRLIVVLLIKLVEQSKPVFVCLFAGNAEADRRPLAIQMERLEELHQLLLEVGSPDREDFRKHEATE